MSCGENYELDGDGVLLTYSEGYQIEGTLFLPEGDGPFPVLIIVPGSGPEDRRSLNQFADIFTPAGFAVYTYDKRATGGSSGQYPAETLENPLDFLNARTKDVRGIIETLLQNQKIDPHRIGTIGSSQGAWVNVLLYNQSSKISFMIMTSGGAASTGIENYYNRITNDPNLELNEAYKQIESYDGEIGYDPLPTIEEMTLPVLWIFGQDDRSHPVRHDAMLLNDLNKSNFTMAIYPNTNHDLIEVNTGEIPEGLISQLLSWLQENS